MEGNGLGCERHLPGWQEGTQVTLQPMALAQALTDPACWNPRSKRAIQRAVQVPLPPEVLEVVVSAGFSMAQHLHQAGVFEHDVIFIRCCAQRESDRRSHVQSIQFCFGDWTYTENDDPHPQVEVAFGLRMTNCAPSSPSE